MAIVKGGKYLLRKETDKKYQMSIADIFLYSRVVAALADELCSKTCQWNNQLIKNHV